MDRDEEAIVVVVAATADSGASACARSCRSRPRCSRATASASAADSPTTQSADALLQTAAALSTCAEAESGAASHNRVYNADGSVSRLVDGDGEAWLVVAAAGAAAAGAALPPAIRSTSDAISRAGSRVLTISRSAAPAS
jgi:hypothetical protein